MSSHCVFCFVDEADQGRYRHGQRNEDGIVVGADRPNHRRPHEQPGNHNDDREGREGTGNPKDFAFVVLRAVLRTWRRRRLRLARKMHRNESKARRCREEVEE